MAKSFGNTKGKAQSNAGYKMKDGDNNLRLVGDILPRYGYWIKHGDDNRFFECLSFDREKEAFTRVEHDPVRDYYPEMKCQWSYVMYAIDLTDNKLVLLNLKKKLYEQIQTLAEDLGDPTDPNEGWNVVFKKVKTGPLAFNVEYTLMQLRCKKAPLTEEQAKIVAEAKPLDEIFPRLTSAQLAEQLDKFLNSSGSNDSGGNDLPSELESVDDLTA